MAQQSIVIVVTENGSRVVKRNFDDLSDSARGAQSSVELLTSALEAIGIGLSIEEIIKAADEFTQLQNRLTGVGTASSDLTAVYSKLRDVALETHQSFESTVNLYSRLELGLKSLGYSQNEVIRFTEELSKAIAISGASTTETKYAVQDLAHGLAAGTVNGRELNGILREMPSLAQLIAQALNVPVGALKEMASKGQISADALIQGFLRIGDTIDQRFGQKVVTVGNAMTDLKTHFIDVIGQMSKANAFTTSLAQGLEFLGDHMSTVIGIVIALGASFTVFELIPTALAAVTGALEAMSAAALANPYLALLAAVVGVITALYYFRDAINLGLGDATTLGDLMRAAWQALGPVFSQVAAAFKQAWASITGYYNEYIGQVTNMTWVHILTETMDVMVAEFKLNWTLIKLAFEVAFYALPDIFIGVANTLLRTLDTLVNGFVDGLADLAGKVGITMKRIDLDLTIKNPFGGAAVQAAKDGVAAANSFYDSIKTSLAGKGPVTSAVDKLFPDAQRIAKQRQDAQAAEDAKAQLDKKGPRTPTVDPNAAKEAQKLEKELEAIEDRYDHILKYVNEYNKAVQVVNQSVAAKKITPSQGADLLNDIKADAQAKVLDAYDKAGAAAHKYSVEVKDLKEAQQLGLITQDQMNAALAVATARSKELTDPFGKMTGELQNEMRVMQENTRQQEIDNTIRKDKETLLKDGIILTDQQTASLKNQLTTLQQSSERWTYQNEVLNSVTDPIRKYQVGLIALQDLLAKGQITQGQFNQRILELKTAMDSVDNSVNGGINQAFDQLNKQVTDVAHNVSQIGVQAFDGFANAIVSAANGGKQSFSAFARSVLEDIEKMLLKMILLKALGSIFGGSGGGGGGGGGGGFLSSLFGGGADAAGAAGDATAGGNIAGVAGFATGGSFLVGGHGGTDSQLVAFRASPNETVTVTRPGDAQNKDNTMVPVEAHTHVRIVNVTDPKDTLAAMNTSSGERLILNVIQRNPNVIKSMAQQ